MIIGVKARRAALKYRRENGPNNNEYPFLQSKQGNRFTKPGFRSLLLRIGKKADLHLTSHMLRRTFATLSMRNGMNVVELQGLLGHSSLAMTERYVQLLGTDFANAHRLHGPIDNL